MRALDDVSLAVLPGEVHGLLGENGSGKSTLIKILSGYHQPEPGAEIEAHGQRVPLPLTPGRFREFGLSFVHQDLGLLRSLSVLENLRIGEFASGRRWWIRWARERRRARETFARYNVSIDPQATVGDLFPVDRALLAIVRAAEEIRFYQREKQGKGLLILDEPTVFLPKDDAERLYELIREVVAQGSSVLFVSHDLSEVLDITDRITVLRDGRLQGTVATKDASLDMLVQMIIGHGLTGLEEDRTFSKEENVVASVEHVSGGIVNDVSLGIRAKEVLGVAGLLGSGVEELPYLLLGAIRAKAGRLNLGSREFDLTTIAPSQANRAGMVLIPADRPRDGSIGSLTVAENVVMPVLRKYVRHLVLARRQMTRDVSRLLASFDVRPNAPRLPFSSLSGGNQQKTLLSKWLQMQPRLLLLHEPTQGVDVGAREQIFSIIRETAASGTPVLCASSDYEQLAMICDRVLILGRGEIVAQLVGREITIERIAEHCYALQ